MSLFTCGVEAMSAPARRWASRCPRPSSSDRFRPYFDDKRRSGHDPVADIRNMADYLSMKSLFPLLLLAPTPASAANHPRTYLLSVIGLPVKDTQSVKAFSIETWGVEFISVCRIPGGWRIKAGRSASPNGELSGEGSQGATWLNQSNPKELRAFVLVTLNAPIQRADIRTSDAGGKGLIPATFKGYATLETDDGDRRFPLTYRNVMLTPASTCPRR
ncbi:hypothetical protein FHW92_005144 [Novosphingobium sp. SG707]|nr:hypothetical protein [Novosphingobium sp. SG707]